MNGTHISLALCAAAVSVVALAAEQGDTQSRSQIERGKYLVEGVAKCGDCHMAHLANGEEENARELQGAPIGSKPLQPIKWEDHGPSLAGGPKGRWTDADVSKLLQTGLTARGRHLDAPMPEYRMNSSDADAVAAYIYSLPKPAKSAPGAEHSH